MYVCMLARLNLPPVSLSSPCVSTTGRMTVVPDPMLTYHHCDSSFSNTVTQYLITKTQPTTVVNKVLMMLAGERLCIYKRKCE